MSTKQKPDKPPKEFEELVERMLNTPPKHKKSEKKKPSKGGSK